MGVEPFGVVAGHMRGRVPDIGSVKTIALVIAQRLRRVLRAVGEPGDCFDIKAALALEHPEENCAWRVSAHEKGARGPATQRVINEPGDRRAVARPGKT